MFPIISPMLAAFLRDPDGQFELRQVFIFFFCICVCSFIIYQLHKALKTGRVLFGLGLLGSKFFYVERKNHPVKFWAIFAYFSFWLIIFVTIAILFCFLGRLGRMPD
jgi:uncharacterized membrane protein (DUF4010 family)